MSHEWKEKIDREMLKWQEEINRLKGMLDEERMVIGRLGEDLK